MNSKQKLSQVKSFAKSKVKEFRQVIPADMNDIIDWSTVTLHMNNYSYHNNGMNLISVIYNCTAISEDKLEQALEKLSINNRLGIYVTVDEEISEIYFFNKALNNHIKTFQLITHDEDKFVQKWRKQLEFIDSKGLSDTLSLLKELKFTSNDVFVQLTNIYFDQDGDVIDCINVEGIIKKVTDKEVVLESVNGAEFETVVKVSENWALTTIEHWQRKFEDIELTQ